MKPAALLLLLAAAASQVDLLSATVTLTGSGGEADISSCPMTYYGRTFSMINLAFNSDSSVDVCFTNGPDETSQDCVVLPNGGGSTSVDVNVYQSTFYVRYNLPAIQSGSSCSVYLLFKRGSSINMQMNLYNFGSQMALRYRYFTGFTGTLIPEAKVGNLTEQFPRATSLRSSKYVDLSACSEADVVYTRGSVLNIIPETCSSLTCDASARLSNITCGPTEVCYGNNTCLVPPVVCTVTGSTVIDFHDRVHSVLDRCAYSLMSSQQGPGFDLVAVFQERRRKDVSFLDHLMLSLPGVQVYLGQGGRVQVDGQMLTLNATAQLLHGVELSKNQTGVTATIPSSNMTVFFDGNTAQMTGPASGPVVGGLCGNISNPNQTTTLTAQKSSSISAAGCEIQHSDGVDSTINCNRSTEHCNLMRKAPFTACHMASDPEPYITACTNTLCEYPPLDGLNNCQFLEAYARSCSLKDIPVEDWRSTAGCSAVPHACQDQYCSRHEFCGEKLGGNRCLCRALFASKYEAAGALGEPTVCMQNSATLTLAECLLGNKGIDYTNLRLNDQNCVGHMDYQSHMVTFSFDSSNTCGTEVLMNNSQIIYKNTVVARNSSTDVITRHDQVEIDFSCIYRKPDIKSVSFRIKDSSVIQQIVSGVWNYTLMMSAYTDAGRMDLIRPDTEIQLDQQVWLELKTVGLDGNMVAIVTKSCWATNQPSPSGGLRYDLVVNGCPNAADQTVTVQGNGLGTSNGFSFKMFQFTGQNTEIYLHCEVDLCPKQGRSCAPTCGGGVANRKRRSSRPRGAEASHALITMAWSN